MPVRNEWYGDKRDFLKWPSVLHLAQREGIRRIVQIAMYTDPGPADPGITTLDGDIVQCQAVAAQVAGHFHRHNNLNGIAALGQHLGIDIEVWLEPFTHATRAGYFANVLNEIQGSTTRTIWFFDPDTGIETPTQDDARHVRLQELADAFEAMQPGDWLVCYQHARRERGWRALARTLLANQLGVDEDDVEVFMSNYANDVIVLAVEKP